MGKNWCLLSPSEADPLKPQCVKSSKWRTVFRCGTTLAYGIRNDHDGVYYWAMGFPVHSHEQICNYPGRASPPPMDCKQEITWYVPFSCSLSDHFCSLEGVSLERVGVCVTLDPFLKGGYRCPIYVCAIPTLFVLFLGWSSQKPLKLIGQLVLKFRFVMQLQGRTEAHIFRSADIF